MTATVRTEAASNLPVELSSFAGREQDKARVRRLLAEARLVSLTGAGGSGKTRLALQVARSLSRRFPDGVWLAELAGLADPDLVWHVVGAAVGVLDVSKEGLPVALRRYLRSRRLLLVLDNCEHLAAVCAAVVAELLASCPRLSGYEQDAARGARRGALAGTTTFDATCRQAGLARASAM